MKKLQAAIAAIMLLSVVTTVTVAAPEEDFEAKCKAWASEDGIAEDKVQSYVDECVAQLQQEAQEQQGGEQAKPADSGT